MFLWLQYIYWKHTDLQILLSYFTLPTAMSKIVSVLNQICSNIKQNLQFQTMIYAR